MNLAHDLSMWADSLRVLTRSEAVAVLFLDEAPEEVEQLDEVAEASCSYWTIAEQGGAFFTTGERSSAMARPVCALIPQVLATGRVALSLGCEGAQRYSSMAAGEAYMGLPGPAVAAIVEQLQGYVAAPDQRPLALLP